LGKYVEYCNDEPSHQGGMNYKRAPIEILLNSKSTKGYEKPKPKPTEQITLMKGQRPDQTWPLHIVIIWNFSGAKKK